MLISPITKERLDVQVVGNISRSLNEWKDLKYNRFNRQLIESEAKRALALSSVPIIIRLPFKAVILDEYSNFKCNVILKDSNNEFSVNTENICKFNKISLKTFDGEESQFVECKCSQLGNGIY